jgi:hypothetical protein
MAGLLAQKRTGSLSDGKDEQGFRYLLLWLSIFGGSVGLCVPLSLAAQGAVRHPEASG